MTTRISRVPKFEAGLVCPQIQARKQVGNIKTIRRVETVTHTHKLTRDWRVLRGYESNADPEIDKPSY